MSSHSLGFGDGFTVNAYTNHPPAIIRPAEVRNCAWYEQRYEEIEKQGSLERGALLDEFKKSAAWREKYKTWNAVCDSMFGISKRYADKLILNYTESEMGTTVPIGALHSSAKSPEIKEKQLNVKDQQNPSPAKSEQKEQFVAQGPIRDETGEKIPARCLPLWSEREDAQQWMGMASKLKCFVDGLGQSPNGNYRPLSGHTITLQKSLTEIYRWLEICKPYAVCYACHGVGKYKGDDCPVCYSRGLISKNQWNDDWTVVGKSSDKAAEVARRKALV